MGMWPTSRWKSSWDQRQCEPWHSLWEFHILCSLSLVKQQHQEPPREAERYYRVVLFILFPLQICHRDIHCSTRASKAAFLRRACLGERWSWLYTVGMRSYIFKDIYRLYLNLPYIAVLARVWKKLPLEEKEGKYTNVNIILLPLFRLCEGMDELN